jgi:hypothetical protein
VEFDGEHLAVPARVESHLDGRSWPLD